MKTVELPLDGETSVVALVHELFVIEPMQRQAGPVDLWSMVMSNKEDLVKPAAIEAAWNTGYTLQAKLAAVDFHHDVLGTVLGEPPDSERLPGVQSYTRGYRLLSATEALLNAIYGVLEVVAGYRHLMDRQLPSSFRDQMKREGNIVDENPWLGAFYDLRSEFTHYSSAIVSQEGSELRVRFSRQRTNLHYVDKSVDHVVEVEKILALKDGVGALVDTWSRENLSQMDPDALVPIWEVRPDGEKDPQDWRMSALLALVGL